MDTIFDWNGETSVPGRRKRGRRISVWYKFGETFKLIGSSSIFETFRKSQKSAGESESEVTFFRGCGTCFLVVPLRFIVCQYELTLRMNNRISVGLLDSY
jgi:hypothetical protein